MTLDPDALPPAALEWGGTTPRAAPRASEGDMPAELARAHALAARLPPSVEGHGGDAALFHAACELSTVLGEDADAIETVLAETFNPRCTPPWPASKLRYEAARALARVSTPEARYARRAAARTADPDAATFHAVDPDAPTPPPGARGALGRVVCWTDPEPPLEWYCEALGIAPSERKVTLIAGDPGSGKGPLAGYLATCFALGVPAFGTMPVKQCNVGILDFEGARLSERRIRSYARGFGRDPAELEGRVHLCDCDPGAAPEEILEWCLEREVLVLVIDSYMSAMSAYDVDPNAPDYASLARELGSFGIVVIIVAHARKVPQGKRGERPALGEVAGSYALAGMAATAIVLWRPDEDDPTLVRVGCARAPEEAFASFDVRWSRSGTKEAPIWTGRVEGLATADARKADAAEAAGRERDRRLTGVARAAVASLTRHHIPQTINALAKDTGLHHRDLGAALAALENAELATREVLGGTRGALWAIVLDEYGRAPMVEIVGGEARRAEARPARFTRRA